VPVAVVRRRRRRPVAASGDGGLMAAASGGCCPATASASGGAVGVRWQRPDGGGLVTAHREAVARVSRSGFFFGSDYHIRGEE
jgi:hypothetical protein